MRKQLLSLLSVLICTASLVAQNVTYELRWDSDNSLYGLYVTRDITAVAPVTTGGTSAVTIVFPTDGATGTRTLSHTSESVSTYNSAGIIRSPSASTDNDFYVFNSTGGASYIGVLEANVEVLWMTFTPSDGNADARLFENDTDPNSTDAGMMGINARSEFNVITTTGVNDEFSENVLDTENSELEELVIYPNPASSKVNIVAINPIDSIEVYDILGKQVKQLQYTNEVDVSKLNSGMYLFKIRIGEKVRTKRIIIE